MRLALGAALAALARADYCANTFPWLRTTRAAGPPLLFNAFSEKRIRHGLGNVFAGLATAAVLARLSNRSLVVCDGGVLRPLLAPGNGWRYGCDKTAKGLPCARAYYARDSSLVRDLSNDRPVAFTCHRSYLHELAAHGDAGPRLERLGVAPRLERLGVAGPCAEARARAFSAYRALFRATDNLRRRYCDAVAALGASRFDVAVHVRGPAPKDEAARNRAAALVSDCAAGAARSADATRFASVFDRAFLPALGGPRALPPVARAREVPSAHVALLSGRARAPGDRWEDLVARSLLDLVFLAGGRTLVGTWGSTFSTLAADLAGPGASRVLGLKSWATLAHLCLKEGNRGDGFAAEPADVPDSWKEGSCRGAVDDGAALPTSPEQRLSGGALAAACGAARDRGGACRPPPADYPPPFGLECG